jgi:murein DD-endopeptidase MepM/ murein hydrolase activator NlpD
MATGDRAVLGPSRTRLHLRWLCVVGLLCLLPLQPACAAKRVALLIGNAQYSVGRLVKPPQDVREIESALKAAGFGEIETVFDADQRTMKRAIRDFGKKAEGAEIAFLYYSGHGTQANGENYLIPVNAAIDKEADYEIEAVSANALMRQIANARPKATIVVLDACRDNPVAFTRGGTKGLSRMDAPSGTMIAFSTAPNATASDQGHYAKVLARQIRTPGLELLDVFRNTTAEVMRLSGGRQEPRMSEVAITDRVYFLPQQVASVAMAPTSQALPPIPTESLTLTTPSPSADPTPSTRASAPCQGDWVWPTDGPVLKGFQVGEKGIKLGGSGGEPVYAAADGRVAYAGSGLRGYGNLIIIKHGGDCMTAYAHNDMLLVKVEQSVHAGQEIAKLGSTDADSAQLGFEIRVQGKPIDPLIMLPPR